MQHTYNFAYWFCTNLTSETYLWTYSEQSGLVNKSKLYLENGDFYQGALYNGKRQGFGTLTEYQGNCPYVYSGEWRDDRKHGTGTLTSLSTNPLDEYFYDGEW